MMALMNETTSVHSYIEYALDFANAGLYAEAERLLLLWVNKNDGIVYPMVYYALGYFASKSDDVLKAIDYYKKASQMAPDYCFPNKLEEVLMLQDANRLQPNDSKAWYYLGNFWYGARQHDEAIACWERSVELDDQFPTVLRNLALGYYNKRNRKEDALACLEKAFALDTNDDRILMELDQLYKKLRRPHKERLAFLEKHLDLVERRDDLSVERVTLYNQLGEYEKAKSLIASRKFHPWEGGEGKISGQYIICRIELAKKAIAEKRYQDAIDLLKRLNAILSILEKENSREPKKTIYIILWVVPMKDWVIRKMPNFILERLRSVQPNLRLHSSITTNNLTRYIIKDLLGVSWETRRKLEAVSISLSIMGNSISSTM